MAHPMKQHMAVKNTPKTCQKLIPSFKLRHIVIETRRKIERKSDDERRSMKLLCSTYLKLIAAVFGAANVINFVNLANKIRFFFLCNPNFIVRYSEFAKNTSLPSLFFIPQFYFIASSSYTWSIDCLVEDSKTLYAQMCEK